MNERLSLNGTRGFGAGVSLGRIGRGTITTMANGPRGAGGAVASSAA